MQSQQDEEVRSGIALYNSDTDDWTLVSPPPSEEGSKSPDTSPERSPIEDEFDPKRSQKLPKRILSRPALLKDDSNRTNRNTEPDPDRSCLRVDVSYKKQETSPGSEPMDDEVVTAEILFKPTTSAKVDSHQPVRNKDSNPPQSCSRVEAFSKKQTPPSPPIVCSKKHALTSESSSFQQIHLTGAIRSERANDADDESDGMTEVNLDENGMASFRDKPNRDATKSDDDSSNDWTDNEEEVDSGSNNFFLSQCLLKFFFPAVYPIGTVGSRSGTLKKPLKGFKVDSSKVVVPNTAVTIRPARSLLDYIDPECIRVALGVLIMTMVGALAFFVILHTATQMAGRYPPWRTPKPSHLFNNTFDFLYSDPTNHAYTELKMLNEEIADCIERENPVMRELAHWRSMNSKELSKYKTITNTRPFMGLVCYENEVKWRKRFNFLKTEFNFDLRKITRQIKRRLTNDILVNYHPNTPFELILNQLEYLDHIEQRRKDRALEKLKAENLELLRKLDGRSLSEQEKGYNKSQYSKHQHQKQQQQQQQQQRQEKSSKTQDQSSIKSLIILESENVRLRREVDTLKSRLGEKAGTIYIKQSLELEKCERENNALRHFHQDVAEEINSNLIRVGSQQAADPSTHMTTNSNGDDEDNSLSARLASTRLTLIRLGDEVAKLVERNKYLEKEFAEAKMLNALAIREARKNLIEDTNQTKHSSGRQQGQDSLFECEDNDHKRRDSSAFQYDSARGVVDQMGDKHLAGRPEEGRRDWLSKRAQLREQLRESSSEPERHLSDLRRVLRSVPQALHTNQMHNYGRSTHIHDIHHRHYSHNHDRHFKSARDTSKGAHDDIKGANNDISSERQRLDSLKRLNKRLNRFSSSTVNSYNENSYKNCKNHHKRDEL